MKYLHNLILMAVIGFFAVSCSSGKKAYNGDDAYYSTTEHDKYAVKTTAPVPAATEQRTDNEGNTYITNNTYYYDDNDWYDWNSYRYSTRIRRFHQPAVRFGYYDPFFAAPYWHAPNPGWSITFGYGYGGYYPFYGAMPYPNYYYDPFYRPYYRPMYNPYMYSYNPYMGGGHFDGFYGGGGGYYNPAYGGGGGGIGTPGGGTGVAPRTINAPRQSMGGSVPDRNRENSGTRPGRINRETPAETPRGRDVDGTRENEQVTPQRDGRTIDRTPDRTTPVRENNTTSPTQRTPVRENENVTPREQEQNRGTYNRTDVFPERTPEPQRHEPQRDNNNTQPAPRQAEPQRNDNRYTPPTRNTEPRNVEPRRAPERRQSPSPRQNVEPRRSTPAPQRSTPQRQQTQPRQQQYNAPSSPTPSPSRTTSPRGGSRGGSNDGGGRLNRPR